MILRVLLVLALLLLPSVAIATECPHTDACVPDDEMDTFYEALREKKCLLGTTPTLDITAVTLITDVDGRVYFSGESLPFGARLTWCTYTVEFEGELKVVVAKKEPPAWGFRFRPKFAGSFLVLDAIERSVEDGVDVGFLWDFVYWHSFNLNMATGFRSAGVAVGFDITRNFGAFGGYAFSFWTLKSNPQFGLYFGF